MRGGLPRIPWAFLFIAGSSRAYSSAEAAPDLPPSSSTASQCRVRHSPRRPGEGEGEA